MFDVWFFFIELLMGDQTSEFPNIEPYIVLM